jgi:hypothetical protein
MKNDPTYKHDTARQFSYHMEDFLRLGKDYFIDL